MKGRILFLYFICMMLVSCNKDDAFCGIKPQPNGSPLLFELATFNDSLLQNLPQSRVTGRTIIDRMSVVVSDVIGAYECGTVGAKIGAFFGHPHVGATICGLVGGAYSSYKCYDILRTSRSLESPVYQPLQVAAAYAPALGNSMIVQDNLPKRITVNYSIPNTESVEFGAKHNVIVYNLQKKRFALDSEVKRLLTNEEFEILSSEDFISEYDRIVNYLSDCIVNGVVPTSTNNDVPSLLMNLFASIMDTYSDKAEDTEFIINKYIEAVKKTPELSNEEKDNIYNSLSVAASSYEFWDGK